MCSMRVMGVGYYLAVNLGSSSYTNIVQTLQSSCLDQDVEDMAIKGWCNSGAGESH